MRKTRAALLTLSIITACRPTSYPQAVEPRTLAASWTLVLWYLHDGFADSIVGAITLRDAGEIASGKSTRKRYVGVSSLEIASLPDVDPFCVSSAVDASEDRDSLTMYMGRHCSHGGLLLRLRLDGDTLTGGWSVSSYATSNAGRASLRRAR